jgi:hypothetical protein
MGIKTMNPKLLLCLTLVLGGGLASALADNPAYSPARDWVEKHCTTNTVPKDERIFLCHNDSNDYANIVLYDKGIDLREIVDQTPFKDKTVSLIVMRPEGAIHEIVIKPAGKIEFEIKPLDVVLIYDHVPIF